MNLSVMRSELRNRVADINSVMWTDAQCVQALNLAAQQVSMLLAQFTKWTNYGRVSFAISTNGVLTSFALTSKTDVLMPMALTGGASNNGGVLADETKIDQLRKQYPTGKDTDNRYFYWLTYDPTAPTAPWALKFLVAPPTGSWTLIYYRTVTDLVTGTDDANTYNEIPKQFHAVIVECTASDLLGHDASATAAFADSWMKQLISLVGSLQPKE